MSSTGASNPTEPPPGRVKQPSLLACMPCRKSHLKCDGRKPLCSRCQDRNGECFWVDSRRGYREYRRAQAMATSISATATDIKREDSSQSLLSQDGPQHVIVDVADPSALRALAYEEIFKSQLSDSPFVVETMLELQSTQTHPKDLMLSPSNHSDSTMSISREVTATATTKDDPEPTDLIEIFYKYFYPGHPFIVPRNMYVENPLSLPHPLRAVLRYLASHYVREANHAALETAAKIIFSDEVPDDGYKVQGLLLYAIVCFARCGQEEGTNALDHAISLAIRIGLNRQSYAIQHGRNDPTLQEMWRRTWWTLMIIEGMVVIIGGQSQPFRLYSTFTDVALPGDDEDYNELRSSALPRNLAELRNRTFSEDTFEYSSFAYAVEGTYILGSVLALGPDTFAVTDPQVEAIDATISNYFFSLPLDKREVIRQDDRIDQSLAVAHLIVNWAAILLHRPRSTLTFIRNHYRTTCTRAEAAGLPALAYSSHTAKALRAANNIVNLATIQKSMAFSSPTLMCGITTAATVHLPAYAIVDRPDQAGAIKERLQLGISALASFGEIWPRAMIAKGQVAKFAREVLTKPNVCVDSTGPGMIPRIAQEPMPQLQYDMPYDNEMWMENLIGAEQDVVVDGANCPVFDQFAMSNVPGNH